MPEPKEAGNREVSFSLTKRNPQCSFLGHGNSSTNPLGVTVTQRRDRGEEGVPFPPSLGFIRCIRQGRFREQWD